jgi:hypothetical protein
MPENTEILCATALDTPDGRFTGPVTHTFHQAAYRSIITRPGTVPGRVVVLAA